MYYLKLVYLVKKKKKMVIVCFVFFNRLIREEIRVLICNKEKNVDLKVGEGNSLFSL